MATAYIALADYERAVMVLKMGLDLDPGNKEMVSHSPRPNQVLSHICWTASAVHSKLWKMH